MGELIDKLDILDDIVEFTELGERLAGGRGAGLPGFR